MSDSSIISLVIGSTVIFISVFGAAVLLAYRLGTNATRIDNLEAETSKDRVETRDKIGLIFAKLELLTTNPTHHCLQIESIASIIARQDNCFERLIEHSQRMDRMQSDTVVMRAELLKLEADFHKKTG